MAQSSSPSGPAGGNVRKGEPISKRSYTLRLTVSSIMTALIVLVIGIGWSFVLGVMVGRGYNPEKKIPQLASFLPKEEENAQTDTSGTDDNQPTDKIMRAEDLSYSASLKGKPGQGKLAPSPPKAGSEAKPKNMQNATAVVATTHNPASDVTQPPMPTPIVEKSPPPAKPEAPKTQALFDFVFQTATFKETDSVDKLRARLEGAGLRTRMEKTSGKTPLYKVMVLFRGNAEAAQDIKQILVDMGLGQPIQRGKSPVGSRR